MFGVVIREYSGDGGRKLCPLTLADSQARERETQKQLDMLIIRFKHLEGMISELKDFLKSVSTITPVILAG